MGATTDGNECFVRGRRPFDSSDEAGGRVRMGVVVKTIDRGIVVCRFDAEEWSECVMIVVCVEDERVEDRQRAKTKRDEGQREERRKCRAHALSDNSVYFLNICANVVSVVGGGKPFALRLTARRLEPGL